MASLDLRSKLAVLADAAKYDASCASSGAKPRGEPRKAGGIGSITGAGICHSYAPDGRCISLLKLLLTNHCIYDCLYCVNRVSSDVQAGAFTPEEVVRLTLDFLPAQLYRGAVPLVGHHPLPRTIRWSSWSASRSSCAWSMAFAATST